MLPMGALDVADKVAGGSNGGLTGTAATKPGFGCASGAAIASTACGAPAVCRFVSCSCNSVEGHSDRNVGKAGDDVCLGKIGVGVLASLQEGGGICAAMFLGLGIAGGAGRGSAAVAHASNGGAVATEHASSPEMPSPSVVDVVVIGVVVGGIRT